MRPPRSPTPCNNVLLYEGRTTQRCRAWDARPSSITVFHYRAPELTAPQCNAAGASPPGPPQPPPVLLTHLGSWLCPCPNLFSKMNSPTPSEAPGSSQPGCSPSGPRPSNLGLVYTKHGAVWSEPRPQQGLPLLAHGKRSPYTVTLSTDARAASRKRKSVSARVCGGRARRGHSPSLDRRQEAGGPGQRGLSGPQVQGDRLSLNPSPSPPHPVQWEIAQDIKEKLRQV